MTVFGTYPVGLTDFSGSLSVAKFDPDLGTLVSVQYKVSGTASGTAGIENLGPTAKSATATVGANLLVQRPDLTTLASVPLLSATALTLGGFDGVPDFAGSSGASVPFLNNGSVSGLLTSPADLNLFTSAFPADLSISLPVGAAGVSQVSGGGNFLASITSEAGAEIEVTYTYNQLVVPEAGTYLAALGLGGVVWLSARRRSAR